MEQYYIYIYVDLRLTFFERSVKKSYGDQLLDEVFKVWVFFSTVNQISGNEGQSIHII